MVGTACRIGLAAILVSVAACATNSSAPHHRWTVSAHADHLPLEGLSALPHVALAAGVPSLVNFADEPGKEAKFNEAMEKSVKRADTSTMGVAVALSLPACLTSLVACAAVTGSRQGSSLRLTKLPQPQADGLAAALRSRQANVEMHRLIVQRLGSSSAEFPRLVIYPGTVILLPAGNWAAFRIVAEAQAFSAPQHSWPSSLHVIDMPWRHPEDLLDANKQLLHDDLQQALSLLADDIARVYKPYHRK